MREMAAAAAAASPSTRGGVDVPSSVASAFDSDDFNGGSSAGKDREVDLSQLFSDVSRTVGNLKNILTTNANNNRDNLSGAAASSPDSQTSSRLDSASSILNDIMGSRDDQPGPIAKLFGGGSGGVCFKTCGFEDIQFAARRAGEMFFTMKVCLIILTFVAVICFLAITVAVLFYIYKNRHTLRNLTSNNEDATFSVTPLMFSKRAPPTLSSSNGNSNNNPPPKPPPHNSSSGNQQHHQQQKHSPVSSVISSSTD